ncbi:hypothetical protein JL720_3956 [Aureococcus anophagefferens]|nr:hypothetical protein JL720_3956 [Aureococcus anophagefferens]
MDDPFAAAQAARARAELRRSTNDAKLRDFRKKVAARLRGDRAKQAAANPYRPPAPGPAPRRRRRRRARRAPPRPAAAARGRGPDAAAGAGARFAAESPGDEPAADDEDGPAVVASLAPLPSPTEPPFACDLAPQTDYVHDPHMWSLIGGDAAPGRAGDPPGGRAGAAGAAAAPAAARAAARPWSRRRRRPPRRRASPRPATARPGATTSAPSTTTRRRESRQQRRALSRDRNREYARNTRLRKKAYVAQLERAVHDMAGEKRKREDALSSADEMQRRTRDAWSRCLRAALYYRGLGEVCEAKWRELLAPDFVLTLPACSAEFDNAARLARLDLSFDVLGVMRQLQGARDGADLDLVPNTLAARARWPPDDGGAGGRRAAGGRV